MHGKQVGSTMKHWRSLLISMGILVVVSTTVSAQSNSEIDTILAADQVRFGEVAYLVMTATKRVPDNATQAQAASVVEKQGWKLKVSNTAQPVTLGEYCYLIMKAFGMHGGIMYSIFPSPRYAARELVYLGFVKGGPSPYRTLSGTEAVSILGNVLRSREGT